MVPHRLRTSLCLALLGLAALPSAAAATFPGENGKLAFDGVYTMNPDGTGITRPTVGAFPAWSPDGTRIAFSTNRDGNFEIYVMNADGSDERRLTSDPAGDIAPSWSPDGRRLVFQTNRHGNADLYLVNADGTGETRLTGTPEYELRPRWSPSGTLIAFEDGLEITTIRPDGSGRAFRLEGSSPTWAPNGHDLWSWFIYYDDFLEDYYTGFQILNVETGAYDHSQVGGHLVDPVVSPDGQALLYGALGGGTTYVDTSTGSRALPGGSWNNGDWQALNPAPQCTGITPSPPELRPVDRRFRGVTVSGGSDSNGNPLTLEITGVTQDEPVTGAGDSTRPDAISGSAPNEVRLRAERKTRGDGRVYRLAIQGRDARGATCEGEATVKVRRHKKRAAVDSAPPRFDSFD